MIKYIIAKTSYSALPSGELKSNLGDLVRATILANCIDEDCLWLTDQMGYRILRYFFPIDRLVTPETFANILPLIGKGTCCYNLDNYITPHIRKLSRGKAMIKGYCLRDGDSVFPENEAIASLQPYSHSATNDSYQESLVKGAGFEWGGQDYTNPLFTVQTATDIGLNHQVHKEWSSKRWPERNWKTLAQTLEKHGSVSWQQGLSDIDSYIRWMASCRTIITHDTFGLHLASALKKNVIALAGPTQNREFPYSRVVFLTPDTRSCMPCNQPECRLSETHCMEEISIHSIIEVLNRIGKRDEAP